MVYHDAQDTLLVSHLGSGEEYFFPHRPFRLVDSPDPFLSISSLRDVSGYYFDKDHTMLTINMDNNGRLRYIKKKLELIEGAVKQVEKRANDPEDAIRIKVTEPTNISEYLVQKRRDGSIKFCSANDDSMNLNFFEADIFDIAGCMKLHNMYKSTPGMAERVIQRKKALAKEKRDIAEFNKNLFTESDIANLPLLKLTGNYSGGFGLVKWVFHDGHLAIQYPLCPLFEYTVFVKNGVWYLDPLNTQTKRAIIRARVKNNGNAIQLSWHDGRTEIIEKEDDGWWK